MGLAKMLRMVIAQQQCLGLSDKGLVICKGTVVDATITTAPSSAKDRSKARDPEMHPTKKGEQ
jgi:IS5 family transposase